MEKLIEAYGRDRVEWVAKVYPFTPDDWASADEVKPEAIERVLRAIDMYPFAADDYDSEGRLKGIAIEAAVEAIKDS